MSPTRTLIATGLLVLGLAGCRDEAPPVPEARPLRVVTVTPAPATEAVTLTGSIAARVESKLSFRTNGRVTERLVDVGDRVRQGQVLARLDPRVQLADVEAAKAAVASAEAQVRQAAAAFGRAESLLGLGFTTRRQYDAADEALKVARANATSAAARLASASESEAYTDLRAEADGVVTARELDVGETAQAASTVFAIALDGPRDAVFDLSEGLLLEAGKQGMEAPEIRVALVSAPAVRATGRVRQISPTVDRQNGTVRVKIGLETTPEAMTLGAAVTGTGQFRLGQVVVLPSAAMTSLEGRPAVWVLDPAGGTVAMRPIHVSRYDVATVVVDAGLQAGDRVVVDGLKLLRPGQKVAAAERTPTP